MDLKSIITSADIKLEDVKDSFIDQNIGDIITKLIAKGYSCKNITIKDMYNQVCVDRVSAVVTKKGIEFILPFSTCGEHEWREDIADMLYQ